MKRTIKKIVIAMLVLVFYFTILTPFIPQVQSFVNAFIQANSSLFKYNTTSVEYEYVNGSIVQKQKIITIDYTTFMSFVFSFIIAFLPALVVLGILFSFR